MNFGQYELLEMIALGGMAEVYRGRVAGAEGFEKYVAIKRIVPDLSEDDRFVKMLLTEARIHSGLSHRNIVQIHDLGISEDGEYFIVLEFVEGFDLRMIMEQFAALGETIPEALSLHIAAEVAEGLHFAHEQRGGDGRPLGLVHRDVTPSNVLVSMAGEVKLSDFGLAKRNHDRSVIGSLKGNLAYMSPEQARQAPLDRRTDVFSLGAVLFEMLTGRRLREIDDEIRGWDEVAAGNIPSARSIRPELPESFEEVLNQALAPDPARRFPTAAAFGAALRGLLAKMHTPVGASDLQALLGLLTPSRRPRSPMERSKVIRLGPENALGSGPIARSGPHRAEPPPIPSSATPRERQPTQGGPPRKPTPLGLAPHDRPPPPTNVEPPIRLGQPPSAASALRRPRKTPMQWPSPPPVSPVAPWPPAASVGTSVPRAERSAGTTQPLPVPPGLPSPVVPVSTADWPARPPEQSFETQVLPVLSPPDGTWRPVVLALAALTIITAFTVHLAVIPLDVLFLWFRPATLVVRSDPPGASVKLDGVPLAQVTPLEHVVRRDRANHVLELTLEGYRPVREIVRTDRSVSLSSSVVMQKDLGPGGMRIEPLTTPPDGAAALGAPGDGGIERDGASAEAQPDSAVRPD